MTDPYQILVVDDDPSIVNIIETALTQAGYRVLTADNGNLACDLAGKHHPHLIIMDVIMPQCNGILAMKRFVKCFIELLTQNFLAWQETGQKKGCKTRLWTVRSRFRQRNGNGKNTTRPLTVWIVGTDVEWKLFFVIWYGIISPSIN